MRICRDDIIKIMKRIDEEKQNDLNDVIWRMKEGRSFVSESYESGSEAKTFLAMLYLTRKPVSKILNLKAIDIHKRGNQLIFVQSWIGEQIKIDLDLKNDPIHIALWDYIASIPFNSYVFYTLREHNSIYYLIQRWLMCLDRDIKLKDFYK